MSDHSIRIRDRAFSVSRYCVDDMRVRLTAVPVLEKADIAYRASTMLRQALSDRQLTMPLRGDLEDAIAILLVLGVTVVHD